MAVESPSRHRLLYVDISQARGYPKHTPLGIIPLPSPPTETTYWEHELPMGLSPNLVCSLKENGKHSPVLDLDEQVVVLKPSERENCYHLILSPEMSWWKYRILLWWLWKCGILEEGFYKASVARKKSCVRI